VLDDCFCLAQTGLPAVLQQIILTNRHAGKVRRRVEYVGKGLDNNETRHTTHCIDTVEMCLSRDFIASVKPVAIKSGA
jgi:hypothetical protein